jgi:hypothetical protein
MRTLLRNTVTNLYFLCPDKWTDDPARAFDFRFIDRALDYVHTWQLEEVELAFAFDDTAQVTVVSLKQASMQCAAA